MRINERLRIAVYGALCMCVCVFSACLFALMKRFHLATVLVVGSVCAQVCVCVCVACIYSMLCVYYLKVNDKRINLTRGRKIQSLGCMKEEILHDQRVSV